MSIQRSRSPEASNSRAARIDDVLLGYLQRYYRGEYPSKEAIISANSRLMPDLGERLDELDQLAVPGTKQVSAVVGEVGGLHFCCPYCHESTQVPSDTPISDITCRYCDGRFNLLSEEATSNDYSSPYWPQKVGHFEVLERIGVGSFGSVWRAYDQKLDRTVALKMPRSGRLNADETERFLREARAAAQLRHPNIVAVHQVGISDDTVFIVSDLISGVSLADHLAVRQMSFRKAAELTATIASALEHAHTAGVIHRDLKPQNIMLDGDQQPHIMDFGLARRHAGDVTVTLDGQVLGSPAYMSPEQANGESHQAGPASDVYSQGVILFELLTGELPFRGNPSTIIHQVINDDPPDPRKLNQKVPRDLATICLKCLEKKVKDRYGSAQSLADDLWRYLNGHPIQARPISRLARGWRWTMRHPAFSLAAALTIGVAVIAPLVAARDRQQRHDMHGKLYSADMQLASNSYRDGNLNAAREFTTKYATPASDLPDHRGFEWYYLQQCLGEAASLPRLRHDAPVTGLGFSPDGKTLAVASGDQIHLWDVIDRKHRCALASENGRVLAMAFSPTNSESLALVTEECLVLWDLHDDRRHIKASEELKKATSAAFSPDAKRLAIASDRGLISLLDVQTQAVLEESKVATNRTIAIAFAPDGDTIATSEFGGGVTLYRARDLTTLRHWIAETAQASVIGFNLDQSELIGGGNDAVLTFWDANTGKLRASMRGHKSYISSLTQLPDQEAFATAGRDGVIKLWNATSKRLNSTLRSHTSGITALAYDPNRRLLASASGDGEVILWSTGTPSDANRWIHGPVVMGTNISPDGNLAVSVCSNGTIRVWNTVDGTIHHADSLGAKLWDVDFSPDGRTVAVATTEGVIFLDTSTWEPVSISGIEPSGGNVDCVRFSTDGTHLVIRRSAEVELLNLASRTSIGLGRSRTWFDGIGFSPDGELVAIPRASNRIDLWSVGANKVVDSLEFEPSRRASSEVQVSPSRRIVRSVAFSPRSAQLLAVAVWDQILIWDLPSRKEILSIEANQETLESLAFSPDGSRLVSSGSGGPIKIWNLSLVEKNGGREVGILYGHVGQVSDLTFSPDGRMLISGGYDTTVRIWRSASSH